MSEESIEYYKAEAQAARNGQETAMGQVEVWKKVAASYKDRWHSTEDELAVANHDLKLVGFAVTIGMAITFVLGAWAF